MPQCKLHAVARLDAAPTSFPASDYRRRARRLRATCFDDAPRLYAALRQLSDETDARRPPARLEPPSVPTQFANLVAAALQSPVLRYSQRTRLLALAHRLGIPRFEANLIIALVQHRASRAAPVQPARRSLPPWTAPLAAAAVLQSLILAAAAYLFT